MGGEGREGGATALRTQRLEWASSADAGARTAPRRGRDFRQDHKLERAAQGGQATIKARSERRRGDDLPCDAAALRCGEVAHRILHEELFADCSGGGHELCKLMDKRNRRGSARPYILWDRGTKRHAPVPVRPYFSRFIAPWASEDTPVPQAAVAAAEDARFALLVLVVPCWVSRCFGPWVLLGLFCLLRITQTKPPTTPPDSQQTSKEQN